MIQKVNRLKSISNYNFGKFLKNTGSYLVNNIEKRALFYMLFIVVIFGAIKVPFFFTLGNVQNLSNSLPVEGLIAVGMTLVILTGGLDLSVGSIMALVIVIIANLLNTGHGVLISLLIGIGLGAGVGFINGLGVTKAKLPPFLVTLATMISLRGIALIITDGYVIPLNNHFPVIDKLAWTYIGPISIPAFILLGAIFFTSFILKYTNYGRAIYAVGGDQKAAKLAGITVDFYLIMVYVISGFMCGIASIIWLSVSFSANPTIGPWTNLNAIAMVCIGGTSVFGGRGSIWGTAVGILLLGIIANIFDLMGIAPWYKDMIVAVIILFALGLFRGKNIQQT